MMNDEITSQGRVLVQNWQEAKNRHQAAQQHLDIAYTALECAERELAKWLFPGDAKDNEQFCVWFGDALITARYNINEDRYEVYVRSRGKRAGLI